MELAELELFLQLNYVLMLNMTDYLHQNGFGVK